MSHDGAYVQSAPPTVLRASPAIIGKFGHRGTIHSTLDGIVNQSREVAWTGGRAAARQVQSMVGESHLVTSQVELHFIWNSGCIDAEAQSSGRVRRCDNRSGYAHVLPPGAQVQIRVKEARRFEQLSVGFEREFLAGAAAFERSANFDVIETWYYEDPLSWQLARVIYGECISGAPQGILYTETAATLLAMHLVRNLSTATPLLKEIRRGGLPPSRLRCACDYMMSRLECDISLQEVAASVGLSTGHFSTAFKQSLGMAPHAWLRRQRIDRAKALLHDHSLHLGSIALIVGFANQSAFGVAFKKETGLTPTTWRRRFLL